MTATETRQPESPIAAGLDAFQQAVVREQLARDLAILDRHIAERETFTSLHRAVGLTDAERTERHALAALAQVRQEMEAVEQSL